MGKEEANFLLDDLLYQVPRVHFLGIVFIDHSIA